MSYDYRFLSNKNSKISNIQMMFIIYQKLYYSIFDNIFCYIFFCLIINYKLFLFYKNNNNLALSVLHKIKFKKSLSVYV